MYKYSLIKILERHYRRKVEIFPWILGAALVHVGVCRWIKKWSIF